MKDKSLPELLTDMRDMRGKLAALDVLRKEVQTGLSAYNDEVLRRMNTALDEQFGDEFLPRVTFYTDDRKTLVTPLVATVSYEPKA